MQITRSQIEQLHKIVTHFKELNTLWLDEDNTGVVVHFDFEPPSKMVPLTTSEIVDCAAVIYQCDPNNVSERDIKFARHIERLTQER